MLLRQLVDNHRGRLGGVPPPEPRDWDSEDSWGIEVDPDYLWIVDAWRLFEVGVPLPWDNAPEIPGLPDHDRHGGLTAWYQGALFGHDDRLLHRVPAVNDFCRRMVLSMPENVLSAEASRLHLANPWVAGTVIKGTENVQDLPQVLHTSDNAHRVAERVLGVSDVEVKGSFPQETE